MKDIILSTITGFGCGVVFAAFKLPVPAPPVFAGVAGIIGLWIGFTVSCASCARCASCATRTGSSSCTSGFEST
ncbi:MAG: DUF1427 family protein [Chitinophagia bacterium]|nr:DUF1427 family protein [Chitinophagia bacterium]